MPKETNKYSIGFVKAKNKCGTVVEFYKEDTILQIGTTGKTILRKKGEVKLQYTDQNYGSPTDNPKQPPYPNIGGTPPFDDDYLTGEDYLKLQGNGSGGSGVLGAGKKLDDLPNCTETPLRVDIFPSIGTVKQGESIFLDAYVFGGENPSQSLTWSVSPDGVHIIEPQTAPGTNNSSLILSKAKFTPSTTGSPSEVIISAAMFSNPSVAGSSVIQITPP